ncbi:hypothetical protein [Lentibacillus sp. Marseille-P4043]|uniref:hypothetical protein n=1 Tax=Lentibacillus sp. Marseille-P4043 TaxID=2040293 RepID=UPI000D0AC466|nr:hypothetical protein [Lentibacillus sp. Marseille-P4043]
MRSDLTPNFFIKNINIHTVEGASCVNFGINEPTGFTNHKKHNQGFGSVSGDSNTIDGIKTLMNDKSLIDMLSDTGTDDLSEIRELITSKVIAYLEEEKFDEMNEEIDEMETGEMNENTSV